MTHRLHHKDILGPDHMVHLSRAVLTSSRPKSLHDHDFFELFWVQNGIVRHHTPNGLDRLEDGNLALVFPGQAHAVQGKGDHSMIVSLCIHPDVIEGLRLRHPVLLNEGDAPLQTRRNIKQLAMLNQAALVLESSKKDRLAAEAFLLPLLADMHHQKAPKDAPVWLARAIEAAYERDVFCQGAAGFVAQTGRAHAHVSRTMRKVTGLAPSEFINTVRMEYAARVLITDNEPISQIAEDCGIPNMAHFHKLFRAHHKMTPLQYRQQFQRDVIQPK